MSTLFGHEMTRDEIMKRVGDISQIARIVDYRFQSGRAEGMRGLDVVNGSGLEFSVVPSRCLDITWASYKGIPLSFISKSGISSPFFFEKDGLGFLRNFTCGLTTTCGLTYMGAPCNDQGEELGLHGRISNTPAQNCSYKTKWEGNDLIFTIEGQMRESSMFGDNMVLNRKITTELGSNCIKIEDTVVNEGFKESPFMLMYHCNFGFPIIDKNTKLLIDSESVKSRDPRAEEGIDEWNLFDKPISGFTEQLYYLNPVEDKDGYAYATIENPDLLNSGIQIVLKYRKNTLPYCSEWKQIGEGDYVVGIEPGTWLPEGRAEARKRGQLKTLKPGENYTTEFQFIVNEL
ncbi:aldose 1-epimerase family protein [Clostridium sp. cel8]|jgi:galactose mutarotase-like enzyme|uniref:aldose 1-epimerase family protein n=1 Tax=unclassified Clostridium TaxID=2614128 RepID=UPI0015F5F5F7|nr:aldose 1-epimerase family protein [Clostridium sp. cel8]MBA5851613.1 aldose 1-epimerase family protein [Clostridium sp. cel8]